LLYQLHGHLGFPDPEMIFVLDRTNTGAGRRVSLSSSVRMPGFSGYLDMGGHFIEMEGIENGMMAVVSVVDGSIDELEFSVYGECLWNGEERVWKII
jgi:hypothetical protein